MNNPPLNKLRKLRLSKNLTCKQMAQKLSISKSMYNYIELGEKRLSSDLAIKIAEIFGTTADDLFYDDFDNFYKNTLI